MAWKIEITQTAQKQIKKLDKFAQSRIYTFLKRREQAANPRDTGKALKGKGKTLWRYRVGDYRIICHIDDETISILVIVIGHRKTVYQAFKKGISLKYTSE